jgi:putative acetyltransferase
MIRGLVIRPAEPDDYAAIAALLEAAFGGAAEGRLVEALRADGDVVLELVATHEGAVVGHILFSRLKVVAPDGTGAVALAPLAVLPARQRTGIGRALIENAHHLLEAGGENLSVVLGEPAYYGRFGYDHGRAAAFDCAYQGEALQALAWGEAPSRGRLVYPSAFAGL